MISTYVELQSAVANWLDRTDSNDRIPEFIALAEAKFNRMVRAPDMVTKDDAFSITGQYVAHPGATFLEVIRFALLTSPVRTLEYLTPVEMSEARWSRTSSGKPIYFTVVGSNFEFFPTPDQTYTGSLVYYTQITGLSTTSPNWLLTSHPDIYLFGALLEAAPYEHDTEKTQIWSSRLQTALDQLEKMNDRKRIGTTPSPRFRAF